jgi:glycosyltransferase involved in cell wall biosynthesis
VEAFFISQLQFLAQQDFDVTVICSHSDGLQCKLGDNVRYIPIEIPRGISISAMIKATRRLIQHFKNEKYDLVQYSTPNASFCASIASKIAGIKIRNYHLMGFRYLGANGIGRQLLKIIEKISCTLSTSIECVSKSNLELGVKEKIFKRDKATVVWNGSTGGVDLNRFDYNKREEWRKEIRAELGYAEKDFVYGFVGRITKDKGINEILQAFLILDDNSKLFITGDMEGEDTLNVELLRKARENPNIQFHESVIDIERYYAAIDVLLLPSYREGFGNVIIEAGAVGTPAIVSDIPGPTDAIIKDETALVVEAKDVLQLQRAMEKMQAGSYVDMGVKAHKYVSEYFDSNKLNEYILKKKLELLGDLKNEIDTIRS